MNLGPRLASQLLIAVAAAACSYDQSSSKTSFSLVRRTFTSQEDFLSAPIPLSLPVQLKDTQRCAISNESV